MEVKLEEKLGDDYYKEVARLEAIPQERVLLLDLKARILTYKLEIFRHQLLREIKEPTVEAADSMEENQNNLNRRYSKRSWKTSWSILSCFRLYKKSKK